MLSGSCDLAWGHSAIYSCLWALLGLHSQNRPYHHLQVVGAGCNYQQSCMAAELGHFPYLVFQSPRVEVMVLHMVASMFQEGNVKSASPQEM